MPVQPPARPAEYAAAAVNGPGARPDSLPAGRVPDKKGQRKHDVHLARLEQSPIDITEQLELATLAPDAAVAAVGIKQASAGLL